MDKVRIFRILMYEGDRHWVEETIKKSIHGTKQVGEAGKDRSITAATLGTFPEVFGKSKD